MARTGCAVAVSALIASTMGASGATPERHADEWRAFRGPRRDSRSGETGLLREWPAGGPKLRWSATGIGAGFSTVSVADGTIYTAGSVDGETFVSAFDLDGTSKWRAANGPSWKRDVPSRMRVGYRGARSTPTVNAGLVFHLGELGRLTAYQAQSGKTVWSKSLPETFGAGPPLYGYAESVLIYGHKVICYPGGSKGRMVAMHKKSGHVIWANTEIADPASYCSPVSVELGGCHLIVTMTDQAVIGVNASTGKLLWRYEHGNKLGNNVATPICHDGSVYATTGYRTGSVLLRLTPQNDGMEATKVWSTRYLDNHHGGVVLVDGHLYGAGHHSRGWFCLDFVTGEPTYREKSAGKGSVAYADGMLYCLDERGTMSLVKASPEAREVVSSFPVPKGGEGMWWAHPVVCGGTLYIRHADCLNAYDIRAQP